MGHRKRWPISFLLPKALDLLASIIEDEQSGDK